MATLTIPEPAAAPSLQEQIVAVHEFLCLPGKVSLIGDAGNAALVVPGQVRKLISQFLAERRQGNAISIQFSNEDLTTQQAAKILGVSRPFVVKLLDSKKLPHHLVGRHRRVYRKDLLAYKEYRDGERHEALNRIAQADEDAGIYDEVILPEE